MLAGVRLFGGETISETLAAVIKDPPVWHLLPSHTPPQLRALLRRMLEKDPRRRLRDIGAAKLLLEDLEEGVADGTVHPGPSPTPVTRWQVLVPWAIAAGAAVMAIRFAVQRNGAPASPPPAVRFTLPIGGESLERTALPAISPDGRRVVFVKDRQLWTRSLDELDSRPLPGTTGAQFPFARRSDEQRAASLAIVLNWPATVR